MPRQRHAEVYQATADAIKNMARSLMVEHGTQGLSIRGIAKALDLTPPAIYTYFASLDDLITALITENFNALADALENARDNTPGDAVEKLLATLLAYREWSVTYPMDFQLIYGTPIPGYVAPREVTVPAVIRSFSVIVGLIEAIMQSPHYIPRAPYDSIPPEVEAHFQARIQNEGYPVSTLAFYLGIVGWTILHGLIVLEVNNHLGPVVGDTAAHYKAQLQNMLITFGISL